MPKDNYLSLPPPTMPRASFVGRGYYTSAYYVFEPTLDIQPNDILIKEGVEEFDPELEPDYFLEHGYPAPESKSKQAGQTTIILCHALAASGLQFVRDAQFFAQNGFRVIVPDLRGHGSSIIPKKKFRSYKDFSIEQMSGDLIAILDKEQIDQTHWLGSSLGAVLALSIMRSHPERLKEVVVFGTSFALKLPHFSVPILRVASKIMSADRHYRSLARLSSDKLEAQALIYHMLKQTNRDVVFSIMRNLRSFDLIDNALTFDGSILMLRGDKDILTDRALQSTIEQIQDHPLFFQKTIKHAGYYTNLDNPNAVREAVLDFISGGWIFDENSSFKV